MSVMTTMTSTAIDPTINDHLTRVQLRLMRERLAEDRNASRNSTARSPGITMDPQAVKLHRAMLQRQELLDKIKREQQLSDDLRRPRSYQDHHPLTHRSPSPGHRALSRRSLPDTQRLQHYQHGQDTSRPGGQRQVIEHQFRPLKLDPLDNAPPPPPPNQVIQTTVPQPYILNTGPSMQPVENKANTKAELMELMMMQNAQMHQMMMQQLMMSAIPKPATSGNDSSPASKVSLDLDDILSLKSDKKRPPSVHHHHYSDRVNTNPPPQQLPPQPQQQPLQQPPYYTLPPINPYQPYLSPRPYYPVEVEPLKQPRDYPSQLHHYYQRHNAPHHQSPSRHHRHHYDDRQHGHHGNQTYNDDEYYED